jgi:preprotein translocase subunit SecE
MFFSNDRVFLYSLYALGAVVWFVLYETIRTIFSLLPFSFGRTGTASDLSIAGVTLALSVALVELTRRNQKAREFGVDVVVETKKVSWPNRKELQGSTLVVFLMSIIAMLLIFGMDKIFEALIKLIF